MEPLWNSMEALWSLWNPHAGLYLSQLEDCKTSWRKGHPHSLVWAPGRGGPPIVITIPPSLPKGYFPLFSVVFTGFWTSPWLDNDQDPVPP